jgi:hypothetical protein
VLTEEHEDGRAREMVDDFLFRKPVTEDIIGVWVRGRTGEG